MKHKSQKQLLEWLGNRPLNRKSIFLFFLIPFTSNLHAQTLPDEYWTKVDYNQLLKRIYEMVDSNQIQCLKLGELAQYHGYTQFTREVEMIDEYGELLTETEYIFEENVRDEWMEGYHKIVVAKDSIYLFGMDQNIRHVGEKDTTELSLFTYQQAEKFEYYSFGEDFYEDLINYFIDSNITYTENDNIITVSDSFATWTYDHNLKTISITEYDSSLIKVKETVYEYIHTGDDIYVPSTETLIEWFLSENGCCVRKTTIKNILNFLRTVTPVITVESSIKEEKEDKLITEQELSNIQISTISETGQLLITIQEPAENAEYLVNIYDLTGKKIKSASINGTSSMDIPITARAGVYLVHVYDKQNNTFKVGKTIITSSARSY